MKKQTNQIFQVFNKSQGVSIDSRDNLEEKIFFALKGEHFNGNEYAKQALDKGAKAVVIDDENYILPQKNCFLVEDVLTELQNLSNLYRKTLNIPFIGITGTNGKTTTKELMYSILKTKYKTASTKGNFNNHIGVPLTILSVKKEDEIAIIEMGANHQGEIKALCEIAEPDYGIITNIGKAHLEGFKSFQNLIQTKAELYNYLQKRKGMLFVNQDDELLMELAKNAKKTSYSFMDKHANIFASQAKANPFLSIMWEGKEIQSQLIGEYNKYNVLAAIAVAEFFAVDASAIISALQFYMPQNNRSQLINTKDNTLIMDAYNANPSSMSLAIENFYSMNKEDKMLVLGDMFELGKDAVNEHQAIINLLEEKEFKQVFLVGNLFHSIKHNYKSFKTTKEAKDFFEFQHIKGKTILIKASRGMKLESLEDFF